MGQHPNGNGHFQAPPHYPPYQYPPPPVHAPAQQVGVLNIAKGYLPIAIVIPASIALIIGAFQVGGIWNEQQSAIKGVQQDVTSLKQDVKDLRTEVKNSVTEIKSAVEQRSPWQGEVRATAAKR